MAYRRSRRKAARSRGLSVSYDHPLNETVETEIYLGVVSTIIYFMWHDLDWMDEVLIHDVFDDYANVNHRSIWASMLEERHGLAFLRV